MTPSDRETPTYGQAMGWKAERASVRLFPLIASWLATGIALLVASWLLSGVDIESFWSALVAALNAVIPPVLGWS